MPALAEVLQGEERSGRDDAPLQMLRLRLASTNSAGLTGQRPDAVTA
jgi:hypothetical protein